MRMICHFQHQFSIEVNGFKLSRISWIMTFEVFYCNTVAESIPRGQKIILERNITACSVLSRIKVGGLNCHQQFLVPVFQFGCNASHSYPDSDFILIKKTNKIKISYPDRGNSLLRSLIYEDQFFFIRSHDLLQFTKQIKKFPAFVFIDSTNHSIDLLKTSAVL